MAELGNLHCRWILDFRLIFLINLMTSINQMSWGHCSQVAMKLLWEKGASMRKQKCDEWGCLKRLNHRGIEPYHRARSCGRQSVTAENCCNLISWLPTFVSVSPPTDDSNQSISSFFFHWKMRNWQHSHSPMFIWFWLMVLMDPKLSILLVWKLFQRAILLFVWVSYHCCCHCLRRKKNQTNEIDLIEGFRFNKPGDLRVATGALAGTAVAKLSVSGTSRYQRVIFSLFNSSGVNDHRYFRLDPNSGLLTTARSVTSSHLSHFLSLLHSSDWPVQSGRDYSSRSSFWYFQLTRVFLFWNAPWVEWFKLS